MPVARPRGPASRALAGATAALLAGALVAPGAAAAQSAASAFSHVYQYGDLPNQYQSNSLPGCFASGYGTGGVSALVASCAVPANPASGTGTASAAALSSFDPTTGTFKSGASIRANGYTLSQFIPQYDAFGNRIYTGANRPDVLGVYSAVSLGDQFTLSTLGANAATLTLLFDWSGTLRADPQPAGASSYAGNFVNFCTALAGVCGTSQAVTDAFYGGSFIDLRGDGQNTFLQQSSAPSGASPATLTFSGLHAPGFVSGLLTLANIPVSTGTPFDFNFAFGTQAAFYHPTAGIGNIPAGCDPALDPTCAAVDPVDITGDVDADFTHTLAFRGYRLLDAAGNDVTRGSQLTFASGLTPAVTATPEPATIALVGGGLLTLGAIRRRRSS